MMDNDHHRPPYSSPSGSNKQQHDNAEDELDALTDILALSLKNTNDPDFFGRFHSFGCMHFLSEDYGIF